MFTCFICKNTYLSVKILFSHFDLQHSNHNFNCYQCAEGECSRSFYLKNSYSKHLLTHSADIIQPSTAQFFFENNPSVEPTTHTNMSSYSELCVEVETSKMLKQTLSTFLSCLYANPLIPRNTIQIIIDGMEKVLTEGVARYIKNSAEKMLSRDKISVECFGSFINIANYIKNEALTDFKTEHKRFSYFTKEGTYIEPKEMVIGQRLNKVIRGGVSILEPSNCTQQFIPLRNVLKKFFSVENVVIETLEYIKTLKSEHGVLRNFIQGTYWKSRVANHNERIVLPLFMFFDDFEIGNALGSHSGIHKLGGVYVSVPCLPPYRSTVLSNIFIALLFHSSDRVKFGNAIIFKPLIDELNFLQEYGIEIDTPEFKGKFYFELGLILGDNLGLHSITGFTESFSSNYSCRICTIRKEDMKVQCYEDNALLRFTEQYNVHLLQNDVSITGIKDKCVWFDVNNFSLFDQVGVDVMHDMLEGCSKYIMKFILLYYTKELKLLTLQVLNDRIYGFDFGPENNKPCSLTLDNINQGSIRQSASEMLTLIRYFGLLVGDFIPPEELVWELYIVMRRVIDILISTSLTIDSCSMLHTLVAEMNELYLKYSNSHLKPKFHFLTHYHSMIRKFGPVINFWSMRYEAKHRISKISARSSFNRRNICMTLAIRH